MFTRALLDEAWWRHCHHAFSERSWVYRQVDKFAILDDETVRFSTSIDIANGALYAMRKILPSLGEMEQIPLLLIMKSRIQVLSIEVRLNGERQVICNAADSVEFAFSILLYYMIEKLKRPHNGSKDLLDHSDAVKELKDALCPHIKRGTHMAWLDNVREQVMSDLDGSKPEEGSKSSVTNYYPLIKSLIIRNKKAMQFLRKLKFSLPLVAWIDLPEKVKNQRLELVITAPSLPEAGVSDNRSFSYADIGSQLLQPQLLLDREPTVRIGLSQLLTGQGGNEQHHWKIESPDEMLISEVQIGRDRKKRKENIDYSEAGIFATSSHLEVFGSILANSKVNREDSVLFVTFMLRNRVFLYKAIAACVSLVILLSFLLAFLVVRDFNNTTLLLSLIGLFPSTSLIFNQKDDHELINAYLKRSRRLMAILISFATVLVLLSFFLRLIAIRRYTSYTALNPFTFVPLIVSIALICVMIFFSFKFYFLSKKRREKMDIFLQDMRKSWGYA